MLVGFGWTIQNQFLNNGTPSAMEQAKPVEDKTTNDQGSKVIVALGDSLTRGMGDDTGKGYIGYLVDELGDKSKEKITIHNYGVNGYRSIQLLEQLRQVEIQRKIQSADYILITIGGNDLFQSGETMDLDEKIEIDSPKYNISQSNELKNLRTSSLNALNKEIEQIQKNLGSGISENINTEVMDDNFFELRGLSNKNRRLVYIPEKKGAFKLETNTNLILSFNIDKSGTPYNITFVNRSFFEIEDIALNFVKQLRFEAVDYDRVDKAEIVLHFKVK